MGYAIGSILALFAYCFARAVGLDRDRAFYPTVMIVIALLYVLFAVIGGSREALIFEIGGMVVFVIAAVLGFKRNLWFVVAALVGHGIFDIFHGHLIANPGVPPFWPAFCLSYDVVAGLGLAWLLMRSKLQVHPSTGLPTEKHP